MTPRLCLGLLSCGLMTTAFGLHPLLGALGSGLALAALLTTTQRFGEQPKPTPGQVWGSASAVLTVTLGALLLRGQSPWGFFWLLGPAFLALAPLFLGWFARGWRKG